MDTTPDNQMTTKTELEKKIDEIIHQFGTYRSIYDTQPKKLKADLLALIEQEKLEARVDELDKTLIEVVGEDVSPRKSPVSYEFRNRAKAIIRRGINSRIRELRGRPGANLDDIFVSSKAQLKSKDSKETAE